MLVSGGLFNEVSRRFLHLSVFLMSPHLDHFEQQYFVCYFPTPYMIVLLIMRQIIFVLSGFVLKIFPQCLFDLVFCTSEN